MLGAYTGPEFTTMKFALELESSDLTFETFQRCGGYETRGAGHCRWARSWLVPGTNGVGPRALGNRSIVVDPRRAEMKDILNDRIKKREPFRPLRRRYSKIALQLFRAEPSGADDVDGLQVRMERRAEIPAVTHFDGSGRYRPFHAKSIRVTTS